MSGDGPILVVAGNYREADQWRFDQGLSRTDVRYVRDIYELRARRGARLVKVGTWVDRRDIFAILEEAERAGMSIESG